MSDSFTILIAEDDEISFQIYKTRLQNLDLNILHAENGQIAVDMVKNNPNIDLILMDIRMPVLNGYKATEQIREFNKNVPIVAQSATAAIPEKRKYLEMGFTDFFAKPLEKQVFNNIIEKYLNNNHIKQLL